MKKISLLLAFCTSLVGVASPVAMDSVYKFGRKTKGGFVELGGFYKNLHLVTLDNDPKSTDPYGVAKRTGLGVTRAAGGLAVLFNLVSFIKALRNDHRYQLLTALKKKYGWNEGSKSSVVRWLVKHPKWAAFFQFVGVEVGLIAMFAAGFFATGEAVVMPGCGYGIANVMAFAEGFSGAA